MTEQRNIPPAVYSAFTKDASIPVDVIDELFGRAGVDAASQKAFWQQAEQKKFFEFEGKVHTIVTYKNGVTTVHCANETVDNFWSHPAEMTGEQLEEFKRAQDNGHRVKVRYQVENGKKPINSVAIISS